MDVDELAGVAASALALRLGSGVADPLVAVLSRRLQFSYIGKRALAALRDSPTGAWQRELTTSVIADELSRGPIFERALTEALGQAAMRQHTKEKRFRIGPVRIGPVRIGPVRIGGAGLAALIVVVVLVLAGAGYLVFRSLAPSATGPGGSSSPVKASYTGIRDMPFDLDRPHDTVADVVFGTAGVTVVGRTSIGRLAAGTDATTQACRTAIDAYGKKSIPTVKVGDVICVRTSHGGVAAVTLTATNHIEWVYWQHP
jgi:hypothetical protein